VIRKDDGNVWKPKAGVRMFDAETGEYLQYRHIDFDWLKTINPNYKAWKKYYNQFFRQLLNRDLKEKKVSKDPWVEAEKTVIYKALHQVLVIGRTEQGIKSRVYKRARSLVDPIGALTLRAIAIRKNLENGKDISDDKRYPNEAIALSEEDEEQEGGGGDAGDDDFDSDNDNSEAGDDLPKKGSRSNTADSRNYTLDESIDVSDDEGGEKEDAIDKFFSHASPSKKRKRDGANGDEQPSAKHPKTLKINMPKRTKADEDAEQRAAQEKAEHGRLFYEEWQEGTEDLDMEDE
jgi:hypothetical protein